MYIPGAHEPLEAVKTNSIRIHNNIWIKLAAIMRIIMVLNNKILVSLYMETNWR